jgi:prenyl protein peptidase
MTQTTLPSTVLSAPYSLLVSGLITASYVGGLYISRSARLSFAQTPQDIGARDERARQANERWRDDDDVIRARLQAALLSTCASCGGVYACILSGYHGDVSCEELL